MCTSSLEAGDLPDRDDDVDGRCDAGACDRRLGDLHHRDEHRRHRDQLRHRDELHRHRDHHGNRRRHRDELLRVPGETSREVAEWAYPKGTTAWHHREAGARLCLTG
jgi:hypothetical protein